MSFCFPLSSGIEDIIRKYDNLIRGFSFISKNYELITKPVRKNLPLSKKEILDNIYSSSKCCIITSFSIKDLSYFDITILDFFNTTFPMKYSINIKTNSSQKYVCNHLNTYRSLYAWEYYRGNVSNKIGLTCDIRNKNIVFVDLKNIYNMYMSREICVEEDNNYYRIKTREYLTEIFNKYNKYDTIILLNTYLWINANFHNISITDEIIKPVSFDKMSEYNDYIKNTETERINLYNKLLTFY